MEPYAHSFLLSVAALAPLASAQLGDTHCHSAANSTGAVASLTATGSADVAANDVTLHGAALPPGATTLLLSSQERAVLPGFAGTTGTLCLGGAIGRHLGSLTAADPAGVVTLPIDVQQVPHPTQPFALVRGDTLNFQLWFRDALPTGAATSGLSDGLSITFCDGPPYAGERLSLPRGSSFWRAIDLDGDGTHDIVAVEWDELVVLYGLASGGYEPAVTHTATALSAGGALLDGTVDVDGDGLLDCVLRSNDASSGWGLPTLLAQTSPREFAAPVLLSSTPWSHQLVAGDLDGDGAPDLVGMVGNGQALEVLLGDGGGAFLPAQLLSPPAATSFVSIGARDLNGDGAQELYATRTPTSLDVYEWNGVAGLVQTATRNVGTAAMHFIDVDGDGDEDYVAPSGVYTSVLRNEGGGTLASLQERYPSPPGIRYEGHEDVDVDGDVDLVFALPDGDLQILWNDGSGVLYPTVPVDLGYPQTSTRYVDLDGDGHFDAFDAGLYGQWASVRPRTGPTEVAPYPDAPVVPITGSPVRVLDVDGDGREELVTRAPGALEFVHFAAGWGAPHVVRTNTATPLTSFEFGDVDGDGDLDIVEVDVQSTPVGLVMHLQGPPLVFTSGPSLAVPNDLTILRVADIDGDGLVDVLLFSHSNPRVGAFLNLGGGQLQAPVYSTFPANAAFSVVLGDVTGDGRPDLVHFGSSSFRYRENLHDGTFGPHVDLGAQPAGNYLFLLRDVDGDQALDLVTWSQQQFGTITVQRQLGPNQFTAPLLLEFSQVERFQSFDWDGDGDVDLIGGHYVEGFVVYANRGDGTFEDPRFIRGGVVSTWTFVTGDLDQDDDEELLFLDVGAWRVLENRCR